MPEHRQNRTVVISYAGITRFRFNGCDLSHSRPSGKAPQTLWSIIYHRKKFFQAPAGKFFVYGPEMLRNCYCPISCEKPAAAHYGQSRALRLRAARSRWLKATFVMRHPRWDGASTPRPGVALAKTDPASYST